LEPRRLLPGACLPARRPDGPCPASGDQGLQGAGRRGKLGGTRRRLSPSGCAGVLTNAWRQVRHYNARFDNAWMVGVSISVAAEVGFASASGQPLLSCFPWRAINAIDAHDEKCRDRGRGRPRACRHGVGGSFATQKDGCPFGHGQGQRRPVHFLGRHQAEFRVGTHAGSPITAIASRMAGLSSPSGCCWQSLATVSSSQALVVPRDAFGTVRCRWITLPFGLGGAVCV
jgi:hypothetical protein